MTWDLNLIWCWPSQYFIAHKIQQESQKSNESLVFFNFHFLFIPELHPSVNWREKNIIKTRKLEQNFSFSTFFYSLKSNNMVIVDKDCIHKFDAMLMFRYVLSPLTPLILSHLSSLNIDWPIGQIKTDEQVRLTHSNMSRGKSNSVRMETNIVEGGEPRSEFTCEKANKCQLSGWHISIRFLDFDEIFDICLSLQSLSPCLRSILSKLHIV